MMRDPSKPKGAADADATESVRRARAGDSAAFAQLVKSHQDRIFALAVGWLGDAELARDVAQETFTDAFRLLGQLEQPEAFAGWLRRIALKHCDRITRRQRPSLAGHDAELLEPRAPGPDIASEVERRNEARALRLAVEALPEAERLPLALHYFGGEEQSVIAEMLALPLSTVKQRLRSARARLRERRIELVNETVERIKPSHSTQFSDTVKLYIALRAGDRENVRALLTADPALCEAEAIWETSLTFEGVLPFPNRATPLITAVDRGDGAMLDLLLAHGASPDGACGCPTAESPLWGAVVMGRRDLARRLLEAGADANRPAATGGSPLHVAAMRGDPEMADLLVAFGADASAKDAAGRTAEDWTTLRGSQASHTELHPSPLLTTGIKAIDLFAPILRGSRVRVPFRAGVGMVVLLGELCDRFTRGGSAVIWTGFAQTPFDRGDLLAGLRELGLHERVITSLANADTGAESRRAAFEQGLAHAENLCTLEARDAVLIVQSEEGFEADVDASHARVARACVRVEGHGSITAIYITPFAAGSETGAAAAWEAPPPPYDAQWVLDRRRAKQHLFPAIDPEWSHSGALQVASERHRAVAKHAAAKLACLAADHPDFDLNAAAQTHPEAARLARYLTQPFATAEPFTGLLAQEASLALTLERVEDLLAGEPLRPEEQGLSIP